METKLHCPVARDGHRKRQMLVTSDITTFENMANFVIEKMHREEHDDGFYIMNMEQTITLYKKWCDLLPRVRPFYAIKCNPDPVFLRQLNTLGAGFDCASKEEIELALGAGAPPRDIVYANPCKKSSYLSFAAQQGISMMTFDSKEELTKTKELCPNAELFIRFAPAVKGALYDLNNSKFGARVEDCAELLATAKEQGLNVVGVSFHVGSSCFNEMCFADSIQAARDIFDQAEKLGMSLSILDIGGGFPGNESEDPLLFKMCDVINQSLDKHFPVSSGIKIIGEPGTYFARSPFALVRNIIAVKEISKQQFRDIEKSPVGFTENGPDKGFMYFIDDGVYGSFTELLFADLNFKPIPLRTCSEITHPSCVWGHSLDGSDLVNKGCQLPKLSVGDWIYYKNFGAYTSAVSSNFNGFNAARNNYYFITLESWQKMKCTSKDFCADVMILDNQKVNGLDN